MVGKAIVKIRFTPSSTPLVDVRRLPSSPDGPGAAWLFEPRFEQPASLVYEGLDAHGVVVATSRI